MNVDLKLEVVDKRFTSIDELAVFFLYVLQKLKGDLDKKIQVQ